jgi:hypothetical protein
MIIYNNITNIDHNNLKKEYSLFRLSLFWVSAWDPLNQKKEHFSIWNQLMLNPCKMILCMFALSIYNL